jgi:hypothetical protein
MLRGSTLVTLLCGRIDSLWTPLQAYIWTRLSSRDSLSLLGLRFDPEDECNTRYVPPKRQWNYTGPHGITSERTVIFIVTALRTSNPVYLFSARLMKNCCYFLLLGLHEQCACADEDACGHQEPSSSASVGILANMLQLTRRGRYIILYICSVKGI